MNFLKSQTEKVARFLMSGMWKMSLDVEIEPAEINTAGSISSLIFLDVEIEPGCGN